MFTVVGRVVQVDRFGRLPDLSSDGLPEVLGVGLLVDRDLETAHPHVHVQILSLHVHPAQISEMHSVT